MYTSPSEIKDKTQIKHRDLGKPVITHDPSLVNDQLLQRKIPLAQLYCLWNKLLAWAETWVQVGRKKIRNMTKQQTAHLSHPFPRWLSFMIFQHSSAR